MTRVGILSDTHGSLPPAAVEALAGVDRIIHAGDVGGMRVLLELEAIAPLTAVEGNMDRQNSTLHLRPREILSIEGVPFLVVHDSADLRVHGAPEDVRVVVTGHTHVAAIERRGDVLFVNPGSPVSPRRNGPSVAIVDLEDGHIEPHIVSV